MTAELSMAGRLLCFCVLLSVLCVSWARNQTCLTSASTCDQCIRSGPDCGWCIDSQKYKTRCNTLKRLRRAGCPDRLIYNPQGELLIHRNEPADGRRIVLEPQEVSLVLRPGVSLLFTLTITTSSDQPDKELTIDTNGVPEGVNITFKSLSTVNPVVLEVKVNAEKCPSEDSNQNKTGPWSIDLKPRDFSQSMKLQLNLECECECINKPEPHSPECNNHGTLVCGQCLCQSPYTGDQCQTNSMDSRSDDYCRSGPSAPVCSGRGICEDGFCVCKQQENPQERYTGRFCECSNFDCPYHNGRICGGKGKCECGQCFCDEGWTGEECSCSLGTATCMSSNMMICSGRGICECGACKCPPPYSGPTCESCPMCENS